MSGMHRCLKEGRREPIKDGRLSEIYARTDRYATYHSRLHIVEPHYSGAWLYQIGIMLTRDVYCSHFQLCPDDHRRHVWCLPEQRADPAFTVARYTGLQPGVIVWGVIYFDRWIPLDVIRGTLTAQHGKSEEWSLFKTEFNSIISENAELSENEKLYYLRGSLKEEAKIVETADDIFHSLFKALEQRCCVSDNNFYNTPKNCFLTKNLDILDKTLKRFWEIEEVETTEVYSDELKYCNDHFEKTHLRKPVGNFVVEMSFKPDSSEGILGNSKVIASKRLDQLWTRLKRDPAMQTLYSEFLNDYELLQHMEEVKEDSDVENGYYLPHHGLLRLSSETTRLRVVFNASAKMSCGLSINDLLCKGGVIYFQF
ncbi:uncharacterized protein TNCV_5097391 [Trichonephila clavipes]|nr:uncharacterized protein TNCV_5097391 [Trichonephila clavipes]